MMAREQRGLGHGLNIRRSQAVCAMMASLDAKRRTSVAGLLLVLASVSAPMSTVFAKEIQEDNPAAIVEAALAAKKGQPLSACPGGLSSGAGLTVRDGRVTAADLIGEIGGYAGAAATTGGLGGRLLTVTTTADYDPAHERPIPGSLRDHVDSAKRNKEPVWIVFDPALGPQARIELKATLRPPSNMTIDGSCADVTLEAPHDSPVILTYIYGGVQNVIIARLAFRKVGYVPERGDPDSAIRLNGNVDRIAILHNDLSACGDGCVDITVSPNQPVPPPARITVAYNFFSNHDKVMLFGTFSCPLIHGLNHCGLDYFEKHRQLSAALYLTLDGNLFLQTGQRHPRVFGRVSAHILNNVMAFQKQARGDGSRGAAYGIFVSNAARALVEDNVFVPMMPQNDRPFAVWTVKSPGAPTMFTDAEGFVRLRGNGLFGGVATDDQPAEVPEPGYSYQLQPLADLSLSAALACVADRAGRAGSSAWNDRLCSPR